ncbi:MAG: ABC transporter ATP-binding protein [Rhodospirillaceae bacterium]|nr:ABC transporter ATP-binding protein [Rhodospirillaceae bacterium]
MQFVLDQVGVRFGAVEVLRDVSLALAERRIGVIGDNGSGKSTLARLLNALLAPTTGAVRVDGRDSRAEAAAIRRDVGFVFQNADAQIVMPTVAEDAAFGLVARGVKDPELARRTDDALARFGLAGLRDRPSHALSGGEKQLLALAGVLVTEPQAIVFDEPTTMLDRRNAAKMMDVIAGLPQQAVVVTHHVELLGGFDRVIVLERGRVIADDAAAAAIAFYQGRA